MNRKFAMTLAVAAALAASACGNTDKPAGPLAATGASSPVAPPRTPAPEVALPPLPTGIAADQAPKAKDTRENEPKEAMTPSEEANEMPKALHGNNHSSTALDNRASANEPAKER